MSTQPDSSRIHERWGEMIEQLREGPGRLQSRLSLRIVADHVPEGRLANGARICDAIDCAQWLREIAESI